MPRSPSISYEDPRTAFTPEPALVANFMISFSERNEAYPYLLRVSEPLFTNYYYYSSLEVRELIEVKPKEVDCYATENGKAPFLEWINNLGMPSQRKVNRFIERVSQGGARKSVRSLKNGVFEIRIPHGSGLRVYFGEDGDKLILLLIGGDKGTQRRDIEKAKEYWSNYGKQKQKL